MVRIQALVQKLLGRRILLPGGSWELFTESETKAPYLVSCLSQPTILYVSPKFKSITGYPIERFVADGLPFWFSIIHPADMQGVVGAIKKAQHKLMTTRDRPDYPLILEYRIQSRKGSTVWIREFKQIVSYSRGVKNHVLGCFHDITEEKEKESAEVRHLLDRERGAHGLLDVALTYQIQDESGSLERRGTQSRVISAREKQILKCVASGLSSKQIAAELSISENTVETHRRNLLKKFGVNNSTALVREAHRQCLV